MVGNPSITRWIKQVCKKQNLGAFFMPAKDTYMIHFKGKALQGFNSKVFYHMPKIAREKQLVSILKLGLRLNIDEKNRQNLYTKRKLGHTICK